MKDYIVYHTPPSAPAPTRMGFPDLRGEWRIAREALRIGLSSPRLLFTPKGHGEPVMLIPGFKAPESTMLPLCQLLNIKGYKAKTWGLGVNHGDLRSYLDVLVPKVQHQARITGQRVALVGWSLGGVVARELARAVPSAVSTVVTYGSPLFSAHSQNQPITTPIAVIFSRRDTIVSWPACIDRHSTRTTHYEVDSTHFSMGIDPTVWRIVLDRLAEAATR